MYINSLFLKIKLNTFQEKNQLNTSHSYNFAFYIYTHTLKIYIC